LREADAELIRLTRFPQPVPPTAKASDASLFVAAAPDGREFLAAHPEVKAAWLANQHAQTSAQYAELFRALNLSAAQIDRFNEIKANSIAMSGLFQYMLDFQDTALSWRQTQNQLRNVLGDAGYQAYLDYDRARPARDIESQVAGATYFTDAPLTAIQGVQLEQAIVETLPNSRDSISWGTLPWDGILQSAGRILSGPQLSALNDIYQQALYQRAQSDAVKGLRPP
jgi:hypothetical protein